MRNKKSNLGSFTTAKLQAKMRSILAIALVAVIGFLALHLTGCGGGDGNGGDGGDIDNSPATNGQLTITGLSDFNGFYAEAYNTRLPDGYFLLAAQSSEPRQQGKISDGSVTLKVWKETWNVDENGSLIPDENGSLIRYSSYSGNDQNVEFYVPISKYKNGWDGLPEKEGKVTVSFSDGKANGKITNITDFFPGETEDGPGGG